MRRIILAVCLAWGLAAKSEAVRWPDGYPLQPGDQFRPLYPSDPDRPDWLLATARGFARSAEGSREWVVYEATLDRRLGYHQVVLELALSAKPSDLFIRLLDAERAVVSADVFGSIPQRAPLPGNVFLSISLTTYPKATVIQLLIPRAEEQALRAVMLTPASYEILFRTAGDFSSGARAWVRTPVFDTKNVGLLSDLVVMEEGRAGDFSTPISSFQAYGVDSRVLRPDRESAETLATFALDALPLLGRLDLLLQHVDPIHPPELWLNGNSLGPISLDLPSLEDAAYLRDDATGEWRVGRFIRAWSFIHADALRIGDNRIELRHPGVAAGAEPLLIASGIQFKYPWDEIGTYSFVSPRFSTRDEPIAGNISPAPAATAAQDEDVFIVRTDGQGFRPIDASVPKPNWLAGFDRVYTDYAKREKQFTIRLNPANRPARLGLDLIVTGGARAPVSVSLWNGNRIVAPDFLTLRLDCRYTQCSEQLMLPLEDFPEVDTIRIDVRAASNMTHSASISRMQLRAGWPAAVLALGERASSGALVDVPYDVRSAFVPAEVLMPRSDGGAELVSLTPSTSEGEWYGVETRLLARDIIRHGDVQDRYFTEWTVNVDAPALLARIDLLALHLCVTDGLELFVNGERVGPLTLHLPGVQDANFVIFHVNRISADGTRLTTDERYAIDYGAWVRASLVFDGRLLKPGANTIAIGRTPRLKGTNDHYSMKQVRLQLKRASVPP